MKAADFIKSRGKAAPSHPITLRLVADDGEVQKLCAAEAVFRFVPDRPHAAAATDAAKGLASAEHITDAIRRQKEQAHLLHAALRDKDSPAEPFFDSAEQCEAMLVPDERIRLLAEYQHFVETHFPDSLSPDEFKALVEDARGHFFGVLLTKYGYWKVRRALASLAVAHGMSLTS